MQTTSDPATGSPSDAPARSMSEAAFRGMSFVFRIRDLFMPPMRVIAESGMRRGHRVVDFGCGPGSYTLASAAVVGPEGRVIAVDIHPLALKTVLRAKARRGLSQIDTVRSDCATGLPDRSVDVILLYDIFHTLDKPGRVLRELHRVLKSDGVLSFSDHHMADKRVVQDVTAGGLFSLRSRGRRTFSFSKV